MYRNDWLPFSAFLRRDILPLLRSPEVWLGLGFLLLLPAVSIGTALTPEHMGEGGTILGFYLFLGFGAAMVLLPIWGVAAAAAERRNNTLTFLGMLPIRPSAIVLARIVGISAPLLLFFLATVPIFVLYFIYCTPNPVPPLLGLLLLCGLGAANAAVGVASGFAARSPASASMLALLCCVLAEMLLLPALMRWTAPSLSQEFLATPVVVVLGIMSFRPISWQVWCMAAAQVAILFLAAWGTGAYLLASAIRGDNGRQDGRLSRSRKAARPIRDGANPVYAKDRLTRLFMLNMPWPLHRVPPQIPLLLLGAGLAGLTVFTSGGHPELGLSMLYFALSLAVPILTPGIAATAMLRDRRFDSGEQLALTLLSAEEVIKGRTRACVSAMLSMHGSLLAGAALVCLPYVINTEFLGVMFATALFTSIPLPLLAVAAIDASHTSTGYVSAVVIAYMLTLMYGAMVAAFVYAGILALVQFNSPTALVGTLIWTIVVNYFFYRVFMKSAVTGYTISLRRFT